MTVDCVHFRQRGSACLHPSAPKGMFILASCIVATPSTKDPRCRTGCNWEQPVETVASLPYEIRTPEDGVHLATRPAVLQRPVPPIAPITRTP